VENEGAASYLCVAREGFGEQIAVKLGRGSAGRGQRRVPTLEPRKHVQGTQEKPVWVEMVSLSLPCLKSHLEA